MRSNSPAENGTLGLDRNNFAKYEQCDFQKQ